MTLQQVAGVLAIVRMEWPHSSLGGSSASEIVSYWHRILGECDAADVEAAVKELIASGREHAPGPGVVLKTVAARAVDSPDWVQAWREVGRLQLRYSPAYPDRPCPPPEAFSHPAIAAFAIPAWRELATAPAPGTKDHGTFYAQQREAYKAIAARAHRATANAAIGAPRRGELEQAGSVFAAAAARLLGS